MPGFSIVCHRNGGASIQRASVEKTLDDTGLPWHSGTVLQADEAFIACCKTYPGYPLDFRNDEKFQYLFEGYVYNQSEEWVRSSVCNLAESIFEGSDSDSRILRLLFDAQGDFVLWIRDKRTGRSVVLNDVLARLPVYYSEGDWGVTVSRDIRFILRLHGGFECDPLGVAQQLALGHGVDGRTPWKRISLLEPASMIMFDPETGRTQVRSFYAIDFSEKKYRDRGVEENAECLAELLRESCAARAGLNDADVVSLSGGLDSRNVAAGLAASGCRFSCATMAKSGYQKREEFEIAQSIASVFDSPWHLIELKNTTSETALELLLLKSGLNALNMAFILPFFKRIKEIMGPRVTYFTGDTGLPFKTAQAPRPLVGLNDLVDYIFNAQAVNDFQIRMKDAAAVARISYRELRDSLVDYVSRLPERSWNDKYLHHVIYGRTIPLYTHAEDRNRGYFWSLAPLWDFRVVHYAVNIPDGQKTECMLYRHVLTRLSPKAAAIKYAGYGGPLGSASYKAKYYFTRFKKLQPHWSRKVNQFLRGENTFDPDAAVPRLIHRQMEACPRIGDYLDPAHIRWILSPQAMYRKEQIIKLLTMISLVEEASCGCSSLRENPREVLFG